jgi:hypothetical protein
VAALQLIQGANYGSYVRPTAAELAKEAHEKLEKILNDSPKDHVIVIERWTIEALKEEDQVWLQGVIDMNSVTELLPSDPGALSFVRARSGHRVLITVSYFVAMAEKTNTEARFASVKAYLACVDLLLASSNLTAEQAQRCRRILKSFLMGLDFGDSDNSNDPNYRSARLCAMPKGYFAGNKRNVVAVSQNLGTGIGYAEMLFLREKLGKVKTGKLLMAHGIQNSSPLEPTWTCPGAPSVGSTMKASPCSNGQDNERCKYVTMVGGKRPSQHFCCQTCHKMFERRELQLLPQQAQAGIPMSVEAKQERARRENDTLSRGKRVETQGLPAVRKMELVMNRTVQSRTTEIYENDPAARTQASKKNREMEQKRLQAGGKPKESGIGKNRKLETKKTSYPPSFMDKLTLATRIWAREYGQEYVFWNDLIDLYDLLLIREQAALGVEFSIEDKPKYLHYSYLTAVEPVLEQCKEAKKKWKVRYYVKEAITRNEQTKDLFDIVVRLLDEELSRRINHGHVL